MATLTLEIPDDLLARLTPIQDQLPHLLQQCLEPSQLTAQIYRHILDFLISQPTPEEIANFRPTPAMQNRLTYLLERNNNQTLTPQEHQELNEYEKIEHLIILLKSGNLPYLIPNHPS
ncbi:hypothetical protein VB712_14810 [Spirulina sp. CCNP1310]|uniref:hypothetical protein n=1 Tax=Spirulina sp. CCNP1310 TaxID=3110249 RepID=UPI002B2070B0|nr:hypothetical protein [Spirulina sp. CCNP1310]MEA5420501.1 hypothetical protein [Spirulina sp. CCNP1310]